MATWTAGLDTLLHDGSLVYLGLFLAALIDATVLPVAGPAAIVLVRLARRRRHGPAGSPRG